MRSRAEQWAYRFYALAAVGAVIGQVWVAVERVPWSAVWPMWSRVVVVTPFAVCLELLGITTAALADERMRLGERALGLRVFSAAVATVAVGIVVVGHWPHWYFVAGFGAFSAAGYLLWMLHAAARRRDALRARGLLSTVTPAYGWYRWLPLVGKPGWRVTHRARELAREQGLGLHDSLLAAERQLRTEARRPAIGAAVRSVIWHDHADPRMADIAVQTIDLDQIAAELEARADYAGWADRLAPAVMAFRRPDTGADLSGHEPDTLTDVPPEVGHDQAEGGGQVTPEQVTAAMTRIPKPTQVEVARELGISERTVRRMLHRTREDS